MQGERELIERAQAGDVESFLALLACHDREIMSVVYRFAGNQYDREDLYQEVFLQCFRSLKKFKFRSSFATWMYRVALNRCISYMRRKKPMVELTDRPAEALDWERREKLRAIHRALTRLNGAQRICFHLHYIEDWSVDRIAEILGCSAGAIKSHLHRARRKVKEDRGILVWQTNP